MPAHRKTCLTQLNELTSLCHDPRLAIFFRSPCALKLTAALHHHLQLAEQAFVYKCTSIDERSER